MGAGTLPTTAGWQPALPKIIRHSDDQCALQASRNFHGHQSSLGM
jgi:hypothetical protein